jgi:hypothetical protein
MQIAKSIDYATDFNAKTFEICELCETPQDPEKHLCLRLPLASPRFWELMRKEALRRFDTSTRVRQVALIRKALTMTNPDGSQRLNVNLVYAREVFPPLVTVADLCEWSRNDLDHVDNIGPESVKLIAQTLERYGHQLSSLSYQAAAARRRQRRKEAELKNPGSTYRGQIKRGTT